VVLKNIKALRRQ